MRGRTRVLAAAAVLLCCAWSHAGPYSDVDEGVSHNDPRFVGWATGIHLEWPSGFDPTGAYDDPSDALGAAPGTSNDVVTFGNGGWAVLTFDRVIRNNAGPDLAVFENGYNDPIFAELAFVEVSTDNVNYARFPSVSLTSTHPGEYGTLDATDIYNLAGKHINNYDQAWMGTPFDLSDLVDDPLVTGGQVDLDNINYVKIVDIYGHDNGTTTDEATRLIDPGTGLNYTTNHLIYDGGNFGLLLTGFDLDAVGILEPIPEPASMVLVTSGLALVAGVVTRRRRRTW